MDTAIMAEDFAFPASPMVLPDGSLIVVKPGCGSATRLWAGRREAIATHATATDGGFTEFVAMPGPGRD